MNIDNMFTLMIAGQWHVNTLKMCLCYQGQLDIVVSGWIDDPQVPLPIKEELDEIQSIASVVYSHMPADSSSFPRLYFQVCTLLAGLERVKTKYFIRARTDEFYSNLELIFSKEGLTKGAMSSNVFVRNVTYHPFHFSDHFFVAESSVFLSSLKNLKIYIEKSFMNGDKYNVIRNEVPPEVVLWLFYLQEKGWDIDKLLEMNYEEAFNVMSLEADIFDVSLFQPYEISCKAVGQISCIRSFSKRANPLAVNDYRNIQDLRPTFIERVFPENSKSRIRYKKVKDLFRWL